MIEYAEKRSDLRRDHKSPVMIEDPEAGVTYRARMINFSNKGLFIETNGDFKPETKVYIGIENSPYRHSTYESPDGYVAKIIWQQDIKDTFFTNGYGVNLISKYELLNTKPRKVQTDQEMRKHPRKPYHKPVYFTSQNQYYKGSIDNMSRGGAFIEAKGNFAVGQTIKLVIPGTKIDNGTMLKGEIIHSLSNGVGIKFKSILRPKTK
jgi:Tfp pilus assembly protein PilZ